MEREELDGLLSTADVARISHRTAGTIHQVVSQGRLRPLKRGARPLLFTRAEVMRWLCGEPLEAPGEGR